MAAILFTVVVFLCIVSALNSFHVGMRPRKMANGITDLSRSSDSSRRSARLFNVVPRSPVEAAASDITNAKRLASTGAAVIAMQILFPSSSQAYGDAEELARKKKPIKEKVVVQETDLGIQYLVSKKGSGPYPNPGDFVVINYTGLLSDGTVFDTTEGKGKKPLAFRMGEKQVIPGLESVIEMLQAGAEATCTIPAKYAYGDKGVCIKEGECLIPPKEKLRYAIKVKTVGAGYN